MPTVVTRATAQSRTMPLSGGSHVQVSTSTLSSLLHSWTTTALFVFVNCLLLSSVSRIVGVTHWKLQDDSITPIATDLPTLSGNQGLSDQDVFAVNLADSDPEFAILLRHTTKLKSSGGSGYLSVGGSKVKVEVGEQARSKVKCPVLTVDFNTDGITSTIKERHQTSCKPVKECGIGERCLEKLKLKRRPRNPDGSGPMSPQAMADAHPVPLTCGEPVESTAYDWLEGIARRHEHKNYPEPEVAMIFKKSETDNAVDLFEVEMGLRKAYQENPQSLTVLNQIGNFWRIKGNTQLAIECFRKALSLSPDHPDLLLNLARVLFNLKFNKDAVYLAKRSLHMKSSDHHVWLQYFTLGEVYKALEKYDEAAWYFTKTLELNPGLHVAELHLRELGLDQHHSVNLYTVVIILVLICVVLIVIYYFLGALDM